MVMKTSLLAGFVIAIATLAAHDIEGKPVTINGTVVDTGCYFAHEGSGPKHVGCATACAKAGIPLAIVDDSGKLYLPIGEEHHAANAKLMPFIEKKVKVSGTLVEKGGMSALAIKTIEAQ
jgi:hypothetical protein